MIFVFLLNFILVGLTAILGTLAFLINSLPFVSNINNAFTQMIGVFKAIFATIPYLSVVWSAFLWLITFEIALWVIKMVFGSHTPTSIN